MPAPEPELGKVTTPSKGYGPGLPGGPVTVGTVHDLFGREIVVRHHRSYVALLADGLALYLDHGRRDEFMRLWCEAETAAEAGNG